MDLLFLPLTTILSELKLDYYLWINITQEVLSIYQETLLLTPKFGVGITTQRAPTDKCYVAITKWTMLCLPQLNSPLAIKPVKISI